MLHGIKLKNHSSLNKQFRALHLPWRYTDIADIVYEEQPAGITRQINKLPGNIWAPLPSSVSTGKEKDGPERS